MLKRFTAAALSTVMCVSAALPGNAVNAAVPQSSNINDSSKTAENDSELLTSQDNDIESEEILHVSDDLQLKERFTAAADDAGEETGDISDNIHYTRNGSGYVYIYGHGEIPKSGNPFKNPETITKIVIENDSEETGISNIRSGMFKGCTGLKSITLPDSIETIGNSAFEGCSSLEQVICDPDEAAVGKLALPASLKEIGNSSFKGCASFTDLIIPEKVSSIGEYAFEGCKGLEAINVPSNVKTIGKCAFSGCSSAKTAVIAAGVESLGDFIFERCASLETLSLPFAAQTAAAAEKAGQGSCVTDLFNNNFDDEEAAKAMYGTKCSHGYTRYIPTSLKTITVTGGAFIPNGAFTGLSGVETITVPDTVKAIGNNAFINCSSLKEAVLPKSLESIGSRAFANCTSLTEVNIAKDVTTIGEYAFAECSSLKTAVIAGGANGIGSYLFNKCIAIESITLPFAGNSLENVEKANSGANLVNLFNDDCGDATYKTTDPNGYTKYVPKSLTTITITGGTRIPNNAFTGYSGVKNFVIADTVTSVGSGAFKNCAAMEKNYMSDNIVSVGNSAFEGCTGIKEAVFGKKLETVGSSAFAGCTGLTDVTVPENVTSIGESAFAGCTGLKNIVIKGGKDGIGAWLLNKCSSVESITLPFAGYRLADVEKANSSANLINLFNDDCGDSTYKSQDSNGYTRYVPKSLETIVITGGSRVSNYAFYGMSSVKSISIPDSVTSFGRSSFQNCAALTENVMTDNITDIGDYAFANCTGIKKAVFGKSTANVGAYAFMGCTSLTDVIVPEPVLTVGDHAFESCSALKTADIKSKDVKLGSFLFNKCQSLEKLTLPFAGYSLADVEKPNSGANLIDLFNDDCGDSTYKSQASSGYTRYVPKSLETIVITGGSRIPNYAFYGMSSLKEIVLPDSLSGLGSYSFCGCSGLEENPMTETIETIGTHAFENCTGIKDIYIGKSVDTIGDYAFSGCTGLENVTVPSNVNTMGSYVFNDCSALKNAVISDGVSSIGSFMFNKCSSLEAITLPFAGYKLSDVNKDGSSAFLIDLFNDDAGDSTYKSSSPSGYSRYVPNTLRSITVTGGERIPNKAFANLSSVEDITIPNTIANIGNGAFSGCEAVANVFFPDTEEKWESVSVDKDNELIDGKVRWLNSDGNYVMPDGTMTTTTTTTTQRTTKAATTTTTAATTTTPTAPAKGTLGDISGDGEVNAVDASMILTYYAIASTTNDKELTAEEKAIADVDGNGAVNATDASYILSYYAYAQTTKEKTMTMEEYMKEQKKN